MFSEKEYRTAPTLGNTRLFFGVLCRTNNCLFWFTSAVFITPYLNGIPFFTFTSWKPISFWAKNNSFYAYVSGNSLPNHWDPIPSPNVTVHLVQLAPGSSEYQTVASKFQLTSPGVNILKIERVQNPHLYQSYVLRKQKMDQDNGGNNERQLFHGTHSKNITAINTQGFNRSFFGVNGRYLLLKLLVGGDML